ncbi:MAG: hypothetical protein KC662_01215 [Candidatus Magasanikbacteria bacterium]|nr:hypothetical protein [Candidatus Magasanikbacteria bacterium]
MSEKAAKNELKNKYPLNSEIFQLFSKCINAFLLPSNSVFKRAFDANESDVLDIVSVKERFSQMSKSEDFAERFIFAAHAKQKMNTAPHPALKNFGSACLYGARNRNWDPNSLVIGPAWFGDDTILRVSVKIIGPTLIDDRVHLKTAAAITRSIIGPETKVEEGITIKDAVIGGEVFIGSGARLTSFSEDDPWLGARVMTVWNDNPRYRGTFDTGRLRLGPVIGDRCRIGANAVLKPGVVLYPDCVVPAGAHLPAGIYPDCDSINDALAAKKY